MNFVLSWVGLLDAVLRQNSAVGCFCYPSDSSIPGWHLVRLKGLYCRSCSLALDGAQETRVYFGQALATLMTPVVTDIDTPPVYSQRLIPADNCNLKLKDI